MSFAKCDTGNGGERLLGEEERARPVKAHVITRQAGRQAGMLHRAGGWTGARPRPAVVVVTRQNECPLEWSANAINFAQKYAGAGGAESVTKVS